MKLNHSIFLFIAITTNICSTDQTKNTYDINIPWNDEHVAHLSHKNKQQADLKLYKSEIQKISEAYSKNFAHDKESIIKDFKEYIMATIQSILCCQGTNAYDYPTNFKQIKEITTASSQWLESFITKNKTTLQKDLNFSSFFYHFTVIKKTRRYYL